MGYEKAEPESGYGRERKEPGYFQFCKFSVIQTSTPNMLYYGTRNHCVRRMAINSWDVLAPFEPPHLDSVTGLSIVKGKLISGSKDKHLRLWDLDHTVNNNKHTFHAFNDYINTVQSNTHCIQALKAILYSTQLPKTAR